MAYVFLGIIAIFGSALLTLLLYALYLEIKKENQRP